MSALAEVDNDETGQLAGYVVADYVAQHIRRTDCPPRSAWDTLASTVDDADDLRRLAVAANARMRYCHEEQALQRLVELHGEGTTELAGVLFRSGREQEAVAVLRDRLAGNPGDEAAGDRLRDITGLAELIGRLRRAAGNGDAESGRRLAELFADGGRANRLRVRADGGSLVAEEDLAELLADRGEVEELATRADRGSQPAAEALAELLATHGRVGLLRERADAGDRAADRQLKKLLASGPTDGAAVQRQIADLRRRLGGGDQMAARQLTTLLFDLQNEAELRREVDAGTFQAAERLVALLNADETVGHDQVTSLLTHGLTADGRLHRPQDTEGNSG